MDFNFLNNLIQQKSFLLVILVIAGAIIIQMILGEMFKRAFKFVEKEKNAVYTRRELRTKTLLRVTNNVVNSIIIFASVLIILSLFNVNINAFVASAGIIGLAVGFGSQQLVKDLINGTFFLYQDQFGEGDYVLSNGVTGRIEDVGMRTITIRDLNGAVTMLENGNITQVTNYSKQNYKTFIDLAFPVNSNIDDVIRVANEGVEAFKDIAKVYGVQDISNGKVTVRIRVKTSFQNYIKESTEIRYSLKKKFEENDIQFA